MVPVVLPFIFSLKVRVNESPGSPKFVVTRLFAIRASTIVGGVKSAAPVVNVTLDGFAMLLPAISVSSPGSAVTVNVKTVSAGRVVLVVRLNDVSAVVRSRLQGSEPAETMVGGVPVPPARVKSSEL